MFNGKGELNASSLKELAVQVAKYATAMEENVPSNLGLNPGFSGPRFEELITRATLTQDGKMALASSLANPIRKNLDYMGVARRALVVEPLGQGEFPTYERDIDVSACVISYNGSPAESRVTGDRVSVPLFTIASNPTVRIEEVKQRRFNVIDRAVQKARQEIMAQEDGNVFAALDAAAVIDNTAQDISDTGMTRRDLVELKAQVERWDNVASKFFMSISEYNDILLWSSGGGQTAGADFDPVSLREVLQTGVRAQLWGADIIVTKMMPPGSVFCVADADFVGVMPVRQDIEVYPCDDMKRLSLGWVVSEIIGIGILNARGVAVGRKNTLVG